MGVLIQVYNFGLDTVLTNFCTSDLKKSLKYFPFFLSMFFFILLLNTIGIIPYSSTGTSYLSVTLILTLIIIIGAYFTLFTLHGINFFYYSYRIFIVCFPFNKFICSVICKYDGRSFI